MELVVITAEEISSKPSISLTKVGEQGDDRYDWYSSIFHPKRDGLKL